MKINCIIIDDEPLSADALIWEIQGLQFDVEILGVANGAQEGLDLISKTKPDLVFLDIEMPIMNGFDMLRQLDRIDFSVVFTTAYDQYAINAFEIQAFDYLLKPVAGDSLERVLNHYIAEKASDQWMTKLENLHKILTKNNPGFNKIAWPTSEGLEFVAVEDIIRCESDSNYTHLKLVDEKTLLVSRTLGTVEEMINSESFIRVHKSHLINLGHISKFVKADGGYIIMQDGSQVPVSRRKKEEITSIFR